MASEPRLHGQRSRRAALVPALAAGTVLLAGCAASALIDPREGPTVCPFKAMTGLDCPACGATRALHFALRGDVVTAAGYNVLLVAVLPVLLVAVYLGLARAFGSPWRMPRVSLSPRHVGLLLVVVTLFAVLRNLPVAPFRALGT